MVDKILSNCVTGKAGHTRIIDTPQVGGHCGFEGCPFPARYFPVPLTQEGTASIPVVGEHSKTVIAVDLNTFFDRVALYLNAWERLSEPEKQLFVAKAVAFAEQVQRQVGPLFYAAIVASAPGAQGAQSFGIEPVDLPPGSA